MTDPNDPFAEPDPNRTVIVPNPGGRVAPSPATAAIPPRPRTQNAEAMLPSLPETTSGLNPLVATANALLNLVPQLRNTLQHADPQGLRDRLVRAVRDFRARASASGVPPDSVHAASYVLCTVLDEAVTSTPWGGSGVWAKESLLVTEHRETWGGEKVFQLLSKLAENAAGNRQLLEFIYVCLALGFQGRYRVVQNGAMQLEQVRERLWQLLRGQRGDVERDLSPNWRGVTNQRNPILVALPAWVVAAACGGLLLAAYLGFAYAIGRTSQPVHADILKLQLKTVPESRPAAAAPIPASPRLATFLAPEIQQRLVAVRDDPDQSVITIRGDGLFAPGSATINAQFHPLVDRIAAALAAVPGRVIVSGHTDNTPIMSARFPSNWHLSQERARSVAQLLASGGTPAARMRADGRGEAEPIAPNDSIENRARNRRVEITLYPTQVDEVRK